MGLSRRGLILSGAGLALASCAPAQHLVEMSDPLAPLPTTGLDTATLDALPRPTVAPPLDPQGLLRPALREQALAALDRHSDYIEHRDRIYVVDFSRHSADARLVELDIVTGEARAFRTAHGVGSDPEHTGFAQGFSNIQDSLASSVGAYRTGGASWGMRHGANVLLDGMEVTNSAARDRAIIVHGADYCEPEWLAREGKLGRSFGCFAVSFADLGQVRDRMGEGRLLYAGI